MLGEGVLMGEVSVVYPGMVRVDGRGQCGVYWDGTCTWQWARSVWCILGWYVSMGEVSMVYPGMGEVSVVYPGMGEVSVGCSGSY